MDEVDQIEVFAVVAGWLFDLSDAADIALMRIAQDALAEVDADFHIEEVL